MSAIPSYATPLERLGYYGLWAVCALVCLFLVGPILVIVPLSFNSSPFLSYPISGLSWQWYKQVIADDYWRLTTTNTLIVGSATTVLATTFGTLAALGLSRSSVPYKSAILAILVSPMIVPLIIVAVSIYFFFAQLNLVGTLSGLIIGHTVIASPFVVITVLSTLTGFDWRLTQAAVSLGASPIRAFFTVTLPIIVPGIVTGAIFAFVTSLDEVVIALFVAGPDQHTLPRAIWRGVRQEIDPSILAVACLLVLISIVTLVSFELLRRRNRRMRGLEA
jgi:putative spermidine/putrescine transport system permease protein